MALRMTRIAITRPDFWEGEAEAIGRLLRGGMDRQGYSIPP